VAAGRYCTDSQIAESGWTEIGKYLE